MTQDHRPCGFDDRNLFSLGSGQTSEIQGSAVWALSEAVRGTRSSLPLACRRLPSPGSLMVFACISYVHVGSTFPLFEGSSPAGRELALRTSFSIDHRCEDTVSK